MLAGLPKTGRSVLAREHVTRERQSRHRPGSATGAGRLVGRLGKGTAMRA